jgi:hypothetical protein
MDIDSLVLEKMEADMDFQTEIETLSDDEKTTAIASKREQLIKETFTEVSEKATRNEELAKNYKTRAEKAEADKKEGKPLPKNDDNLSQKDLLSIVRADVHDDDIDRVVKFAKLEGISIAEALKHSDLKAILSSRSEARKSAAVTSVKPSRAGAPKISDEAIIAAANKGEIPAQGSAEAEALFWARRGGKR